MSARKLFFALSVFFFAFSPLSAYAENSAILYQAYVQEDILDVYISGEMSADGLTCKVSNQAAEVADSGFLADKGITTRTTMLIDVSTSMPSGTRGNVISYIDAYIGDLGSTEELKLVTFGKELTVLQDFTSERYDLALAAGKISFDEKETTIYDAIYNTIPKTAPIDGEPCYYRSIVITDGVDATTRGITREELYLKLQNDIYPIDVIEVTSANQDEPNKDLAALTRISNGRYANLYSGSDVADVLRDLSTGNIFWLRAVVPDVLLDGSTRQVDITDGFNSMQFDIKVSVFEAAAIEEPEPPATPAATPEVQEIATTPAAADDIQTPPPDSSFFAKYGVLILVCVGAMTAITAIILFIFIRRKKAQTEDSKGSPDNDDDRFGKTEVLRWHKHGEARICLRNTDATDRKWDLPLTKDILIGRNSSCNVCLDEISVSKEQCRIYIGNGATVENLSKSNITLLNGTPLGAPSQINVGDKIKCGRITLVVDSLNCGSSSKTADLNNDTHFINV